MLPPAGELQSIIDRALQEDLAAGDVTTASLAPENLRAKARVVPRESGVLAGLPVALAVFNRVDPSLDTSAHFADADRVRGGESVATVAGCLATILMAERTALNFMQRMSGIATLTSRFVEAVAGTGVDILDTRKTAPGLRALDKYAVAAGGGRNHRRNLADGVLIKDNHVEALRTYGMGLAEIIHRARDRAPHTVRIEVEVESVSDARIAMEAGADIVLLDNMTLADVREAAEALKGRCLTEASGNVTLDNVAAIAAAGVDMISVGALTHSAKTMNIGLDLEHGAA